MRKFLLSILLAGVAASPALAAQDRDNERRPQWDADRTETHQQRDQAREERKARAQEARPERPVPQPDVHQQVQAEPRGGFDRSRFERAGGTPQQVDAPRQAFDRSRFERGDRGPQQVVEPANQAPRQSFDRGDRGDRQARGQDWSGQRERFGQGGGWNRQSGDLRQSDRPLPNVMRTRNPLVVSETPREGTQPPLRSEQRRWTTSNWNTNWRSNQRYDWRNWRHRHRSRFHFGFYFDPFGWSYQPYQIGYRLWPNYYGRQYWIDDPWEYRLPYAPPGTVWVRYWDDALLVDTWTGEVVDVIHNFFW